MTASVLTVVFEPGSQRVLARVCGEIDLEDADELRRDLVAALDSSACGLDIDLSGVTFCDCSGLHVLLRLNRLARHAGKTLVLTALGPRVARLLELTGTHHVFTVRARPAPDEDGIRAGDAPGPDVRSGPVARPPRGRSVPPPVSPARSGLRQEAAREEVREEAC
ncbi:STAS domain-containing protein [Streptomyces sp. NPDC018711]|uniref:STAS domain-containing protein n=1 Tax=Streptomyces sp. NPDC018711 TaxID=3365052 RepID=UPI00378C68C7